MYRIAAGNFLFLRLFCPALVDAYEYGLLERQPDAATLRVLVLISKVQNASHVLFLMSD